MLSSSIVKHAHPSGVLLCSFKQFWLSSLELLALLLAAAIHDVDHPGTTNAFQIKTSLVSCPINYIIMCTNVHQRDIACILLEHSVRFCKSDSIQLQ